MRKLTIVVPEGGHNLSSVVGSYKILCAAERCWQDAGNEPRFQIVIAGSSAESVFYEGLFTVRPHMRLEEATANELVIIPALHRDFETAVQQNGPLVHWVLERYREGASLASICTGAFLICATGLLDGQHCSVHWMAARELAFMFPRVVPVTDRIITDENRICTNGGGFAFLHLLLYLVEKYYNREIAIYCSKVFEIDMGRSSQSPFVIFSAQKDHGDQVMREAQEYIEEHAGKCLRVEELARRFALCRRNFDRRFKKATGNTPSEYLQRARIEVAKKCLENTEGCIDRAMCAAGYTDMKAFRAAFKKQTGLTPLGYRRRYNKNLPEKI